MDGSTLKEQETVWPVLQQLNPDIGPCQISPDAVACSPNKDVPGTYIVAVQSPLAQVDRVAGMQLMKRSDSLSSSASGTATTLQCNPEPSLCKDTCKFRFKFANAMNKVCVRINVNFVSSVQMI